jgi:hypothetical protein
VTKRTEDDAVETGSESLSLKFGEMGAEERKTVLREFTALSKGEFSELGTGRRIVQVRSILEKYGIFWRFLKKLPFTERTAYRRIKSYERAVQMWPEEVVTAAIERGLKIVGWTAENPMGFYENVPPPSKTLTPSKIEEYLMQAEVQVRRNQAINNSSSDEILKMCFRFVERNTRNLQPEERKTFLDNLVGLQMTLLGAWKPQQFSPTQIPQDFWSGKVAPETRGQISKSTAERWKRIKAAKLKRRA